MRTFLLLVLFSFSFFKVQAQQPQKLSASEIYEAVKKLNFIGSALYIAAHPDDENTRLISYLSNDVKARTAYLSITRGDGGQNLIGPELRELLGVIRTQELLAARRLDGSQQFFTRANDFGYSKHPNETLTIWDKEAVLHDVVWVIRNFKPDIIINRFNHRSPGTTHGHHTSSAMLSVEAFDLTNNVNIYPEQLKFTDVWQPSRLFFNTSWWFYGSQENFEKADKTNLLNMDIGTFYPSTGKSNNEIAALSRSQHSSQGFGSSGVRGREIEYLELLRGALPADKSNPFDGVNTTWSRIKGGEKIGAILYDIEQNFNFKNPSAHIPKLMKAYQLIENIEDEHWKKIKSEEIKTIIAACSGLYLEAVANASSATPGEEAVIAVEAINRSNVSISLKSIATIPGKSIEAKNIALENNIVSRFNTTMTIPNDATYTTPYWLNGGATLGMYKVNNATLIGNPETPRLVKVQFNMFINDVEITFLKDVVYKYTDRAKGEIYQPFEILPEVTSKIEDKVTIFNTRSSKKIPVKVRAGKSEIIGSVSLKHPKGWTVTPDKIDFSIAQRGEEKTVIFTVTPPQNVESEGFLYPKVVINGHSYTDELIEINYDHIPKQTVLLPSKAKVVRLNIQKVGENIGYIVGAGDNVPESLKQIGYNVMTIDPENIEAGSLDKYDAIVVGIRAYNVISALKYKQQFLLDYVNNGGNLIVQYNTSGRRGLNFDNLAPYELNVSRDRVTDENAPVRFLAKNHTVLNFPNKIKRTDFDGWKQERGLYFPNKWGKEFTPILSMNDKGESPKDGSLLVAPYGKGHYIYTGLSFFRELPLGVPGAYKLFANMLSVGKESVEKKERIKG
ncbi:PIG-L family deacetylase [Leptobacterium sp. I13]|uniref:PIG-L family deacetylase n=1 Tax=Leptobacterium meishanense TaxID=3128904 RepID=UPI0030EF762C